MLNTDDLQIIHRVLNQEEDRLREAGNAAGVQTISAVNTKVRQEMSSTDGLEAPTEDRH